MDFAKILQTFSSIVTHRPFIMFWNVTDRCNLRCKFCDVWRGRGKEMDTAQARQAVSNMCSIGVTAMNIDGGEPLIRKDLEDIALLCRSYGMFVALSTNGTLITRTRAGRLVDAFDQVCVSIDGFEKTHDSIRGRGNFKKAMRGVELLLEANGNGGRRCIIGTNTVITKHNIGEVTGLAKHIEALGADFFGTCPVNDPYPLDIEHPRIDRDMYPEREDYERLVDGLIGAKSRNPSFIQASDKFLALIGDHFSSGVKICDVGKYSLFLDAGGNVCACPRFRVPLFKVLDSDAVEKYRRNKKIYGPKLEKTRGRCPGCLMGCTTDISIRCRFPNYIIEMFRNPLVLRGILK